MSWGEFVKGHFNFSREQEAKTPPGGGRQLLMSLIYKSGLYYAVG